PLRWHSRLRPRLRGVQGQDEWPQAASVDGGRVATGGGVRSAGSDRHQAFRAPVPGCDEDIRRNPGGPGLWATADRWRVRRVALLSLVGAELVAGRRVRRE